MAFAQGSRSGLSYAVETTFGTTPAGNFQSFPYSTHTLNLTKQRVQGNDQEPDRMPRTDRHGNRSAGGNVVFDLRADVYDDFLESLMFSTFDINDELKVGTTPKYFSIEDYAADIDQARLFTGMAVSQAEFSIAPNQMVTSTLTFVGKDMTIGQTEKTKDAAAILQPFDAYSGALSVADTGGVLAAVATITGINFTVNNSLNPTYVIGSDSTPQLEYGMAEITGEITAYFEDATLINRFINETETAIQVSVDDPTAANEYTFLFPKVKFNASDLPNENPQSRIITIPFVSLYDATAGSNLVITRPA